MYIGRVIGTVVATIKLAGLDGRKLLLVQQLDLNGDLASTYDIAIDTVQAGVGDTVLVLDEGGSARMAVGDKNAPVRAIVAGIVDDVDVRSA